MHRRTALSTALIAVMLGVAPAAANDDIVSHITAGGTNTIVQPQALAKLLHRSGSVAMTQPIGMEKDADLEEAQPAAATHAVRTAGFRVQVFSDNRPAAKGEARSKGRAISERFPEMRTYVTYTSPYWRLKVGDFRTKREAEDAAEAIRQAFPSYSREIRVVADKISVGAN
jgi:hypothetical protein